VVTERSLCEAEDRHPPSYFASLYRDNNLTGGHIIKLGPKNDEAAKEACSTWPGGMQVGGGINEDNAEEWLRAGASKVSSTPVVLLGLRRVRCELTRRRSL